MQRYQFGMLLRWWRLPHETAGGGLTNADTEMQSFGFNDIRVNFKTFIRRYGANLGKK